MSETPDRKHITLLQLQTLVRTKLEEALPLPFWVAAEIGELKTNASGHCYLELVEKGGANQVPRARASAVIWRGTWGALRSYFVSATGGELAAGMSVLLRATVSYHELYGFSLTVSDIDLLYTLGDMERRRRETILRLREEGVYDMNRSLTLPPVVQRVAVISSPNAAGYQDFMNELAAGDLRVHTTLFDATMQGHAAEQSVIDALERISESAENYDVTVIIRGGGSQSDLAAFDSYRLASHVAQFPLPVVTGIGHDKDRSVADLVAAVSLKTPTAVAAWLVSGLADFDSRLAAMHADISRAAADLLGGQKRRLQTASTMLSQASGAFTRTLELRLERLSGELTRRHEGLLSRLDNRLDMLAASLRERVSARLARENSRLELAAQITAGRNPDAILALGFAIVRRGDTAVSDASLLAAGDRLEVTFALGTATAEVIDS